VPKPSLSKKDIAAINRLLEEYESQQSKIVTFGNQLVTALTDSEPLAKHIHSIRLRIKDPHHLRGKLQRKVLEAKAKKRLFRITPGTLLTRITDLVGIRILHLYTRQIHEIDPILRSVLAEQKYSIREGPFARTWDDESRSFFQSCGIRTQRSPSMYTSVHYVVGSASRTLVTCELQVRTLMEEVWGEVDHSMNYPIPSEVLACREQLRVLARVTSSATRLVDAIFLTLDEAEADKP